MSKEILQNKTCKELRELASDMNISGRWDMTRDQLIDVILGVEVLKKNDESESTKDECKIDNHDAVEAEDKVEKESTNVAVDMEQKMPYIEGAVVGTIVAFRLPNGKVKSAKIVKKSTKRRQFMLETDYGAQYITPYEDIVWVRTGKRWPRGVYKLLKGLVDVDEAKAN